MNVVAGMYLHSWANSTTTLVSSVSAKKIFSQLAMTTGNMIAATFMKVLCENPTHMFKRNQEVAHSAVEHAVAIIYLLCTLPSIDKVDEIGFTVVGLNDIVDRAAENALQHGVPPQILATLKTAVVGQLAQINAMRATKLSEWIQALANLPKMFRDAGYTVLPATIPIDHFNGLIQSERTTHLFNQESIGTMQTMMSDIEKSLRTKGSVSGIGIPNGTMGALGGIGQGMIPQDIVNQLIINNALAGQGTGQW